MLNLQLEDDDCDFINVPAETPLSPDEAITRRHRKERRELQGKIQSMKKNVNKADKKKKKELDKEIEMLEQGLDAQQKAELDAFRPGRLAPSEIPETVKEEPSHEEEESTGNNLGSAPGTPRVSRARRRREKKEADEKQKRILIEKETFELFEGSKMKAEDDAFVQLMKDLKLGIVDIDPDGNCLYNAISDQLKRYGESVGSQELRTITSTFLRDHKDEFILFMDEEHGSEEGFNNYCNSLEDKATWGGQLEVRILSQVLERPIKVLQAMGAPIIFGDNFSKEQLILTYHRHRYQLGEHYNSTRTGG